MGLVRSFGTFCRHGLLIYSREAATLQYFIFGSVQSVTCWSAAKPNETKLLNLESIKVWSVKLVKREMKERDAATYNVIWDL